MANSTAKEKLKMYDVLLSSPGMSESVKVAFSMSRRDTFLLVKIIEAGLNVGSSDTDTMVSLVSQESREGFQTVMEEIFRKAGLSEFNEKLRQLG